MSEQGQPISVEQLFAMIGKREVEKDLMLQEIERLKTKLKDIQEKPEK